MFSLGNLISKSKKFRSQKKKIINKVINDSILALSVRERKKGAKESFCEILRKLCILSFHRVKEKILIICDGLCMKHSHHRANKSFKKRIEAQIVLQKLSILHNNSG